MRQTAADLARRLAQNAEAVCREYLSNGCREGHTWRVGDIENTPGRSLMVRLVDGASGVAGKWTDFASGEHGDLLDLIACVRRLDSFRDVAEEARRFLSLPETVPSRRHRQSRLGRPRPHAGCSRPLSQFTAPSPRPISAAGGSRTCAVSSRCGFTRSASTAPARMPRARPGRRSSPPSPIARA